MNRRRLHLGVTLLLLLLPIGSSATPPIPTDQVPAEIQKLTRSLQPSAVACASCANEADPCTDLYAASCLKPDGAPKTIGLEKEMEELIQKALSQSSQKIATNDTLDGAFDKFLKLHGFDVRPDLSDEKRQDLRSGFIKGDASDYFSNYPKVCETAFDVTPEESAAVLQLSKDYWSTLDRSKQTEIKKKLVTTHQTIASRADSLLNTYSEREIRAFEEDPSSLVGEILSNCKDLPPLIKSRAERIAKLEKEYATRKAKGEKLNTQIKANAADFALPEICSRSKMYSMRSEAVLLLRTKEEKKSKTEGSTFVRKYFKSFTELRNAQERALFDDYVVDVSETTDATDPEDELPTLESLHQKRVPISRSCRGWKSKSWTIVRDQQARFYGNLAKSKPTIEAIFSTVYGSEQKAVVENLYKQAHTTISKIVTDEFGSLPSLKGSPQLSLLTQGLKDLDLSWPKSPNDSAYKKENDFPLPVLDIENLPPTEALLAAFNDPSLSQFKDMNAEYSPVIKYGIFEKKESVTLMPPINILAMKNKWTALFIVAHEIGHKLGPRISKMNGYDLAPSLKPLLECLRADTTMGIAPQQADEAIADWVAAKVVGEAIQQLPPDQKRNAILQASAFFCETLGNNLYEMRPFMNSVHPETTLRINGILGSNPQIREALGCKRNEGTTTPFRHCGLMGDGQ